MLKRFKDPAQRARIVSETEQAMKARFGGAEGVFLPRTKQELVDVMREHAGVAPAKRSSASWSRATRPRFSVSAAKPTW